MGAPEVRDQFSSSIITSFRRMNQRVQGRIVLRERRWPDHGQMARLREGDESAVLASTFARRRRALKTE